MKKRKKIARKVQYLVICGGTVVSTHKRRPQAEKALVQNVSVRLKRRRGLTCGVVRHTIITTGRKLK